MRGIVLAGGLGTRLWPAATVLSKQLLPVYDKPMIYYPLSILMLAGIRDILVISSPDDLPLYRKLLEDGSAFGCDLSYCEQPRPEGLAQAFLLGEEFLDGDDAALALGDNIFYGSGIGGTVKHAAASVKPGAAICFAHRVRDPERYGVVEFDANGRAMSLEEKPEKPKSNYAIPGLYFYGRGVCDVAREVRPSARGELEITSLNRLYLDRDALMVTQLGRGVAWLDTGTPQSLLEAANFIHAVQTRQGQMVACLEEIAYLNGWIDRAQLMERADAIGNSAYGRYLSELAES
ncbi:MAG: glucose-1-phosphate thymidylyltransferase RfbA [Planctomycetes bacterium]|nr:glucose-1-phosphate thymidylyltransferase RfbA [Planctomycetota bacterium]